jgi:hypothetical protein
MRRLLPVTHTEPVMSFFNPRPANIVGVLHLSRLDRVSSITISLVPADHAWPIAGVISSVPSIGSRLAQNDIVEVRIGIMFAEAFLHDVEALDGQLISARGTRWSQRDDTSTRRQLIDVMFDPIITLTDETEAPALR